MSMDADQRFALLREDAERGVARAQRHLANRYLRGRGVARDPALAAQWMRRAAEQRFPPAMRAWGEYLEQGVAGPADPAAAALWYRRAAAHGDPLARDLLARLEAAGQPPTPPGSG
ncbi:MAG TPA: sel1 repeat family protein, partial [Gammaproteobacteria bacterium]|nr:sel1 repeat family protein [Gammaproteobacteria bacterium]